MTKNALAAEPQSGKKRDPGFVMIRRGLLAHLREMSSNATKLYLLLHLKAFWQGPKRGCVEANIDDLMFFLNWMRSMVKRALTELVRKSYILFEGAANQYELGTIKITKFDPEETDSARLTGEPNTGFDNSAGLTARSTGEPSTEPSMPSISSHTQNLQAPKKSIEVKKEKNGKADAVRRPFDAELRLSDPSPKSASRFKKNQNLSARLAAKIQESGYSFSDWADDCEKRGYGRPYSDDERKAFEATQYKPNLENPLLSMDFIHAVEDVWEDNREKGLLPGILCSKIIDYCESERKPNGGGYYYPPDFVDHRNKLRAKERLIEQQSGKSAGVRA